MWVLRSGCGDIIWWTGYLWRINSWEREGEKSSCSAGPQSLDQNHWGLWRVYGPSELSSLGLKWLSFCTRHHQSLDVDRISKRMFLGGWLCSWGGPWRSWRLEAFHPPLSAWHIPMSAILGFSLVEDSDQSDRLERWISSPYGRLLLFSDFPESFEQPLWRHLDSSLYCESWLSNRE